jgi:acyl carrier protein
VTKDQVYSLVSQSILSIKKDLEPALLKTDARFVEDLGFDSMGLVGLAAELEKNFDRSLPLTQWIEQSKDTGLTLGSLVAFIQSL